MARLPQPGGDNGQWGTILNEFLDVSLDGEGKIKPGAVSGSQIDAIDQSKVTGLPASLASKADNNAVVHTTGNQTVGGIKTFSSSPIVPTPSSATQAANKAYVDNAVDGISGGDSSDKVSKSGDTMSGALSVQTASSYGVLTVGGATTTDAEGDIFRQRDADANATYPVFARYWDAHDTHPGGTFVFGSGPSAMVGVEKPGGDNLSQFRVRADESSFSGTVGLPTSGHLNFGSTSGSNGYGLRDNSGTIEYKDSGGGWNPVSSAMTITAPALTVTMHALGSGRTYSREIPLYNHNGLWQINETMTISPFLASDDVLRVNISLKEVIANGLYGISFSTFALNVVSFDSIESIHLIHSNGIGIMEMWGDMAVPWNTAQSTVRGSTLHVGADTVTIKGDSEFENFYHATLQFIGTLNASSGN